MARPPPSDGDGAKQGFLRSETGTRLLSALVLVALALGAAWLGGYALALFWLIAAGAAAVEWIDMCRLQRRGAMRVALVASLAAASLLAVVGPPAWIAALVCLFAIAATAAAGSSGRDRLLGLVALVIAGLLAIVPVLVRESPAFGLVGLLWMFAVVWGTDIAAYFTGRALGGPKLAPRISPGKTWSGFFGGLVVGTLAATLVAFVGTALGWEQPVGYGALVLLAALASVVGQLGDLAESAAKRRFNVKDSGHTIPGHGGVLDRIDAFVAVCAFVALGLVLTGLSAGAAG